MKKFIIQILILTMIAALIAGCSPNAGAPNAGAQARTSTDDNERPNSEPVTIRIGGLKGPTSMGMVKLLKDAAEGKTFNKYEFSLAGSADEVTPKLVSGELDVAAVPANLASVLYNNTGGKIKLLAINTLGVVYIVEAGETISSITDLKGKTIYATARGSAPEYALNYLLTANGIDPGNDISIEWKTEPSEVVSLMVQNQGGIALMPQPYVTVAQGAIENLRIAVDLTKEWDALGVSSMLLTGVLVIRSDFADKYPDQIAEFLEEYKASTEYVNANIAEASILIEEFDIVKAVVAEKALPFCNIVYYAGSEMKNAMQGYLEVLYNQNPQSIGGALPDDNFYYGAAE
ncbi:MAG: ABC transporter substrate-binding protein [Oscillospiraceae bacterium]|nr:ABC transporter substrate-binding protein [Oscillospiraceae bacterium]